MEEDDLKNDPGIMESIKTCMHILEECKEFSPTMQRFAKVTTDFAQALVYDSSPEAQQSYEGPQPGMSEDFVPALAAAQPNDTATSSVPERYNRLNTTEAGGIRHDPFSAQWDIPDMSYL